MKKHEGNFILTLFSNSPVTFSQTRCQFIVNLYQIKRIITLSYHPFYLGVKRRSSNFLRYIKELIEELKKSETVLLLEEFQLLQSSL